MGARRLLYLGAAALETFPVVAGDTPFDEDATAGAGVLRRGAASVRGSAGASARAWGVGRFSALHLVTLASFALGMKMVRGARGRTSRRPFLEPREAAKEALVI